jgi:hypothetical protein
MYRYRYTQDEASDVADSDTLYELWILLLSPTQSSGLSGYDSGMDLVEQFALSMFCDWIRHEPKAQLARRWKKL